MATEEIKKVKPTPVFWENKEAYESGQYRRIINQGSTRSSKTYSVIQLLITVALSNKNKQISVVSPSLPHLKKGARKDFLEIMEDWGQFREENFNRTDNVYTFGTGSYIEFFGADEPGRVRGPSRDILFVNEANLLPKSVYTQLAIRTTEVVFVDFNPVEEINYVYDLIEMPQSKFIHSTYLNNLANISKEQVEEIEALREADPQLWKVFGLGLRGASSEIIYTHWKIVEELPGKGERIKGMDFGYNVPSALVDIELYEGGVYVDELLYETKLTTGDLIERYKDLGVTKTDEIFADNAEPKTIEELNRAGYNVKPADKDVTEGIRKVKSRPLFITRRSVNILKEIRSYKWKTDKEGKVLDEPVKFMDHSLDAIRYGVFTKEMAFHFKVAVA